jgi:hypothetical protein
MEFPLLSKFMHYKPPFAVFEKQSDTESDGLFCIYIDSDSKVSLADM